MDATRKAVAFVSILLLPAITQAAVPPVDSVGRKASVVCKNATAGAPAIFAVHMDKIIFQLTGPLVATNAVDQPALDAIPRKTELDIKVMDDPATVADLKGKVLSFLGAMDNPQARTFVAIIDVEYAVVCPPVKQPTFIP